ncbi:PH domain-containing protein [Actinokineospora sp. NPDC004072]
MSALPAAPPIAEPAPEWGRLDPRMIVVKPLNELIGLLPLLFALVFIGNVDTWRVVAGVGTVALIILYGLFAWLTTKYRITGSQVELHTGVVFRQRRAIPRDRIRTVDLTAKLGHRLFGLSAVRVGTGQQERQAGEGVVLDAVTTGEAERLRQVFLHRPATAAAPAAAEATEIARLDKRWYRYAPLSLSGLLGIALAVGFGLNLAGELNLRFSEVDVIRGLFGWLGAQPPSLVVLVAAGVVVVLSTLASLLTYLLQNHGFRLTRHADATVRVHRGLLTTRSVSIEEQRLRGVALNEPLLLRAAGGARLNAVTTGLGVRQATSSLLVPPAPRAEAARVAAAVLGDDPTGSPLTGHPPAARTRRLVRAAALPVALTAALVALTAAADWPPLWIGAAALVPVSVLIGLDRYRNLGHALIARYLVTRSGSLNRRTVALQRTGIIGWRIDQSLFQRRVRLMTLTAITAAGQGHYAVIDVDAAEGVRLADAAVPDLLTPFLVRA